MKPKKILFKAMACMALLSLLPATVIAADKSYGKRIAP